MNLQSAVKDSTVAPLCCKICAEPNVRRGASSPIRHVVRHRLHSADSGRPRGATCTQPYVKGLVTMVTSIYNGYRMEDRGALRLAIGLVASLSVCGPALSQKSAAFCDCRLWTIRRACRSTKKRRARSWGRRRGCRPIIFYSRGATCWQPYVKGLTLMVSSIFNGNRLEDIWLDK